MGLREATPVATPTVSSAMAAAVLGSLYAHPHDDTPEAISAVVGARQVSANEITEALEALRLDGLVRSAGSHWQLTAAGYRVRERVGAGAS